MENAVQAEQVAPTPTLDERVEALTIRVTTLEAREARQVEILVELTRVLRGFLAKPEEKGIDP